MNEIKVRLESELLLALERRATAHGHSVDEEVREIVRETVVPLVKRGEWVQRAREIRAMTPPGAVQSDSVKIIRDSREHDH